MTGRSIPTPDPFRTRLTRWTSVARTYFGLPAMLAGEARRWAQPDSSDGRRGVRVYYGLDDIPGPDAPISGGIVKCRDLQRRYPNTTQGPNLLYLVSSALPPAPAWIVRAAHRAGAKFVLNQNGVAYPAWHGAGWQGANAALAWVHAHADFVFYQSRFCQLSAERFLGRREAASEILHNPVDTGQFTPAAAAPPLDRPVLLLAGSHHFFYRVETAIEALGLVRRQQPAAVLHIAGGLRWRHAEKDCIAELQACAKRLGQEGHVVLTGPYAQAEAPAMFQRAHVLLHTQYNDSCPRLVLEAMACGVPVVYSATGGVPELVDEEGGIGIPGPLDWEQVHPPAPAALAAAVLRVIGSHALYARAARQRVLRRFHVQPWLDRHQAVFESLIG